MRTPATPSAATVRLSLLTAMLLVVSLATVAVAQIEGDPPADGGGDDGSQHITIAPTDGTDLSVRLSGTVDEGTVPEVVLASTASFADAMASAVLQQEGPLLLVPPEAPVPGEILNELDRLAPAQVTLLGGTAAISEDVQAELETAGHTTRRLAGPSRIDTAVEIARAHRPNATQAILVRAFDAAGGNSSGAWADSVAAGDLSTQLQIPILLTGSGELSGPTASYLANSAISTVIIVGGTGAVSSGIEQQLDDVGFIVSRVAGATRFETALRVAELRRLTPDRVVLVNGTAEDGWQAGFTAARHAWLSGAPILPTAGEEIPGSIAGYIAQLQPDSRSCLGVIVSGCASAGGSGSGVGTAELIYNPPSGSAVNPGESIVVGIDDPDRSLTGVVVVDSECQVDGIPINAEFAVESTFNFSLEHDPEEPGGDQPRPFGPVPVQPFPGSADDRPSGGATAQPVDPNEPEPVNPPPSCQVTVTLQTRTGEEQVDISSFNVVDLRPRIGISTFPVVAESPVGFTDRTGGQVDGWSWRFGDGGTSSEENPSHTYAEPSCYEVELTASSSLTHWFTGEPFSEDERRLIGVDPADQDEAHLEIYVVDGFIPEAGAQVQMFDLDGNLLASATSGSDGVAVFPDVLDGRGHGTYVFRAVGEPGETAQVITPGQTICPGLQIGLVGDLLATVETADADPQPIPGAVVDIQFDGVQLGGVADEDGKVEREFIPVGTYSYEVRATGFVSQTGTVEIIQDQSTTLDVTLTRN